MGTACACSASISGTKGEAVTFTRASSAFCTKHGEWSSIANGDLVQCSSNQPLIMPGGDGTGPLGTLEEDPGTNLALRSQEFDNASWANFTAGGGINPTKGSADTDVAPDNTTTAERVTFARTADAGDSSGLTQTVMNADAGSLSIYARDPATLDIDGGNIDGGGATGGTFDLAIDKASGVQCGTCAYVAGSWTRCPLDDVPTKASGKIYLGNLSSLCSVAVRPQQTVALWGAQAESGSSVGGATTSYMPSGAAVGTRASSLMSFPITIPASPALSLAATLVENFSNQPGGLTIGSVSVDPTSSNNLIDIVSSPGAITYNPRVSSTSHSINQVATTTVLAPNRFSLAYNGATETGCLNGVCQSATFTFAPFSGSASVIVGRRTSTTTTFHPNHVLTQICFDTTSTGCQ